jgi:hypothetical protein
MHLNKHISPAPIRPQNLSCPVGDTNTPDQGQRGVIVAPPHRNTENKDTAPIILHRGFDTLALAVKSNISQEIFAYLEG